MDRSRWDRRLRTCAAGRSIADPFRPGAHIDVHLPNGMVRQYSITNGPGETGSFVIGVKREPDSAGGSQSLHDEVREGDVLAISEPRNNFPAAPRRRKKPCLSPVALV